MLKVIAIAAVGKNGVIGNGSNLPWNIPEDMKFFMNSTRGHLMIMGRKTFDSLGKPLPKRENAVITRDESWSHDGVHVFNQLETAIAFYQKKFAHSNQIIFVMGGAEIYRLSIPLLDEIWLTEIDSEFEGNIRFPFYRAGKLELPNFELKTSESQKDSSSSFSYHFNRYLKKS